MHHPTDRITHTTAFGTPVVEHWLEREIAQLYVDAAVAQWCKRCRLEIDSVSEPMDWFFNKNIIHADIIVLENVLSASLNKIYYY